MRWARVALLACSSLGALVGCDGELALFVRTPPLAAGALGGQGAGGTRSSGGQSPGGSSAAGGGDPNAAGDGAAGGGAGAGSSGGPLLLDDFEDGDSRAEGFGWWFPTNDGTSSQGWGFEPVNDRPGSNLAVRTHGAGFTDWGAILGVTLREPGSFDASDYAALWFWARAKPDSTGRVFAQFVDTSGTAFGAQLELTETWAEYRVPFASLSVHDGARVDVTALVVVQFLFEPGHSFDVWLDDLAFGP